jgi:hypothetical protein
LVPGLLYIFKNYLGFPKGFCYVSYIYQYLLY